MRRTVLVSGASSGIGRALAARLLSEGHRVIGIARDFRKFNPDNAEFFPCALDLSQLDALPDALHRVQTRFPDIDTLILCAGRGAFASLEEFSYDRIRALMDLNFTSQAYIARAWIPQLKRRRRGDLVFIGSEAALRGGRKGAVYCAGKFALRGFAQALREECARSAVRVSLINPGTVKTGFFDALHFEPGAEASQHILPEDIADLVSLILRLRPETVVDEINLSPLHKAVRFKPGGG